MPWAALDPAAELSGRALSAWIAALPAADVAAVVHVPGDAAMTDSGLRRTSLARSRRPLRRRRGGGCTCWLQFSYSSLPPLQPVIPVPLVALAAAEFVAARRVRAAVRHDPNAKAMTAIVIAPLRGPG